MHFGRPAKSLIFRQVAVVYQINSAEMNRGEMPIFTSHVLLSSYCAKITPCSPEAHKVAYSIALHHPLLFEAHARKFFSYISSLSIARITEN